MQIRYWWNCWSFTSGNRQDNQIHYGQRGKCYLKRKMKALSKKLVHSRWAWSTVWGDGNDEWKCCQQPTFNSIWKAAKRTLYQTRKRRNRWDFPFCGKWRRENWGNKKATGEETSEIKRHLGYVTKPKIKKGWHQENYCTWLAYICRRSAITLFKSNFSFCVFQGWKNYKILAFRDFFAGNNFRDCRLQEYFAGIWFCEFDQISTLKLLKSMYASG